MGKVQDHKRAAKSRRQVDTTERKASKTDRFIVDGVVEECLPNTMFRVRVTDSLVKPMIGKVLLGLVHGNVHKGRLKTNFLQVEAREFWGKSKWAEIHAGHFHSTHEIEVGGLIIRYLPSISPTDEWHNNNLFIGSSRAVVAFVWHEEKGLRQILYSNVD